MTFFLGEGLRNKARDLISVINLVNLSAVISYAPSYKLLGNFRYQEKSFLSQSWC